MDEQRHESKVKFLTWDECTLYGKAAWIEKYIKISLVLEEVMLGEFEQSRGARDILFLRQACGQTLQLEDCANIG